MRVFSNRFRKAILEKKLSVSVPIRARRRLWMLMENQNSTMYVQRDRYNSWRDCTTTIAETESYLKNAYGQDPLKIRDMSSWKDHDAPSFKDFIENCYPSQVLDVIETFWFLEEEEEAQSSFVRDVNEIFEDEAVTWRLEQGEFFKVDETFFGIRLAESAEQSLLAKGFRGAHDEFRDARHDLLAGDTKSCISNSQKAFESALKTLLNVEMGTASQLIRKFTDSERVDELPDNFRTPFGEQVLMSLATLGNRLGRHGQGKDVVSVPKRYAKLTLEIAAAFLNFCADFVPQPKQQVKNSKTDSTEISDDDIPF